MRLIALFCLMICAPAADRPNFSGNWKMNPDKSSFGDLPRPVEYERMITHRDPAIHMSAHQVSQNGDQTVDMNVRTDGRETTNTTKSGEAKTVGGWMGSDLRITTTRAVEGGEIVSQDTWTLSKDGKTLTSVTLMKTPRGMFEVKMVLDKN